LLGDANPGVRQASVYGIGMCAEFGGESMAPLIPGKCKKKKNRDFINEVLPWLSSNLHIYVDVLKRLSVVITHAEARNEENIHPTENAIAAWGRICQHQPTATGDLGGALSAWLSFLPVTEDNIESVVTYGHLCYFIET
jgi:importin-5